MASIFTKIIRGDIPCHKIAENESFIAFLDINPLKKGHTLVVPKIEIDYIFDQEDQTLQDLIVFAKYVAKGIEQVISCNRIGLSVIGLEVPHTHIHLIPIDGIHDMNFQNERQEFTHEELADIAHLISKQI